MTAAPRYSDRGRPARATTLDELVVHLREGGAERASLAAADAFRDGSLPVVATYAPEGGETARERLVGVFESIGDRIRFEGETWRLAWEVAPVFDEFRPDLVALYDRGVERRYGDGFDVRAARFVYRRYRETASGSEAP